MSDDKKVLPQNTEAPIDDATLKALADKFIDKEMLGTLSGAPAEKPADEPEAITADSIRSVIRDELAAIVGQNTQRQAPVNQNVSSLIDDLDLGNMSEQDKKQAEIMAKMFDHMLSKRDKQREALEKERWNSDAEAQIAKSAAEYGVDHNLARRVVIGAVSEKGAQISMAEIDAEIKVLRQNKPSTQIAPETLEAIRGGGPGAREQLKKALAERLDLALSGGSQQPGTEGKQTTTTQQGSGQQQEPQGAPRAPNGKIVKKLSRSELAKQLKLASGN